MKHDYIERGYENDRVDYVKEIATAVIAIVAVVVFALFILAI